MGDASLKTSVQKQVIGFMPLRIRFGAPFWNDKNDSSAQEVTASHQNLSKLALQHSSSG
jgi:hypothetical protein